VELFCADVTITSPWQNFNSRNTTDSAEHCGEGQT